MSATPEKLKGLTSLDLSNIILNENAYFYSLNQKLTIKDITKFFKESLEDKSGKRAFKSIIKEPLMNGDKAIAYYSVDIFRFMKKPSFLKEPVEGILESKYGLFLILEFDDHAAIIRKNVSGVKSLQPLIEGVDYNILAHFLITNSSKIEKIVSSNMNTAEQAIQRKVAEAIDLKGVLSRFGISKQILNTIRMDNDGNKQTVALNTSRVNSFNLKNDFEKVAFWMIDVLKTIKKAYKKLPESSFIDGFATPLKFEDVIDTLEPTFLLLRFGQLKDEMERGQIEKCYRLGEDNKEIKVDLIKTINENSSIFALTKSSDKLYDSGTLQVNINKHSITISEDDFKGIILDYGDGFITTLNQYLNNGNNFMVNFDRVDHVYANRKIFKDSKLLGDLDIFFDAFITYPELKKINSEKGKGYKSTDIKFKPNSLFDFVENVLVRKSDVLICDDLGVEWGDFISIGKDEITFYHAKHKKEGLSAQNLQDVFGQAQKNFGMLELTDEMIDYRKNRWKENYKLEGVSTNISRIRRCPVSKDSIAKIKEVVNNVSLNSNGKRRVFIVIDSISKSKLKKSIVQLKAGKTFVNKGVTLQILWFVNSLLGSAHDLSTELRIICQD